MEKYDEIQTKLLQINQEILLLLQKSEKISAVPQNRIKEWKNNCKLINRQINEQTLRVAVVGAIKSGKSTFTNSIFKGDYLKRGAGVITSIVTKLRRGEKLKAAVYFKSWDIINAEIQKALVLFPNMDTEKQESFDIRRKKNREELQNALELLNQELLIKSGTRDTNSILLSSYLKGYEETKNLISFGSLTAEYEGGNFAQHRDFTGNDSLSVYLKDIILEINSRDIDFGIEIADCQGSDSPNPLHLSMIQEYLLQTHLIIYVISSRTGLRRADIRFLSIIKKMGIIDNILFVINLDFNEHETISDIERLTAKISEELSLIKPDPQIFTFSSLYNLLKNADRIGEKDSRKFLQWQEDKQFTDFSDVQTDSFFQIFGNKLKTGRNALFTKNYLGKMEVIVSGILSGINLTHQVLSKDAESGTLLIDDMKKRQKRIEDVKLMIKPALEGQRVNIEKKLKQDIDRLFYDRAHGIIQKTSQFIRDYQPDYNQTQNSGFTHTLYILFQEFRQKLEAHMTETVNPEIISFISQSEKKIAAEFKIVAQTLINTAQENFQNYDSAEKLTPVPIPNIEEVKNTAGLKFPQLTSPIHYSAKIKTEAIIRLWYYSALKVFKKAVIKKEAQSEKQELSALKHGVKRMKRETEKSFLFNFKNYAENLKFQYIVNLIGAASISLYSAVLEQFEACSGDLDALSNSVFKVKEDKAQELSTLCGIQNTASDIKKTLQEIRKNSSSCDS